jgi:predicted ABC-type ATPase
VGQAVPPANRKPLRTKVGQTLPSPQALRLADIATFYDNSGDAHRLILVANARIVVWQAESVPEWVNL